jgi:hypothetical protein
LEFFETLPTDFPYCWFLNLYLEEVVVNAIDNLFISEPSHDSASTAQPAY